MGTRYAAAYQRHDAFQLVGVCAREHRSSYVSALGASFFKCWRDAIDTTQPDLVCVATHVDSHFEIASCALLNPACLMSYLSRKESGLCKTKDRRIDGWC